MFKKISILLLLFYFSLVLDNPAFAANYISGDTSESQNSEKLTYKDSLDAVNYAYSGYEFLQRDEENDGIMFRQYNYLTRSAEDDPYFDTSFALMSAFLATGDSKYLDEVKQTADNLNALLPSTGLVPAIPKKERITSDTTTYLGGSGQLQAVQAVSFLAREDNSYLPLMNKLANALISYGINPENNLTWYQANTLTGKEEVTLGNCYETQLGQNCSNCAQTLLIAYETDPSQTIYEQKALDILKAVWECRDKSNNLIPEVWDVKYNKPGSNLYPYSDFRYDDMGGAYIRALTLAYQVTKDTEIFDILKTYSASLVNAVWDANFNGGGFRYLTHLDGTPSAQTIETMYGLFIGSLLEAEQVLGEPNGILYEKSKEHADNIFVSGYGLKNDMVPHQINGENGQYWGNNSDSQLNYAAVQFPFGMELLSQESGDPIYRLTSNRVLHTLLERSKVGDNVNTPQGYAAITETQPPYGFELDYGAPSYLSQIFYLPAYALFNSIHPSAGVKIDWQNELPLGVFGLASNMPFFDRSLVNVNSNDRSIYLGKVTGNGIVDLGDMGFGSIKRVVMDGQDYNSFTDTQITTLSGTHSYQIYWNK